MSKIDVSSDETATENKPDKKDVKTVKKESVDYKVLEWTDLIPKNELKILMNPPEYLNDVEDGSEADRILSKIQAQFEIDKNDPYQRALVSTNIVTEMDGEFIRLPGFVVPIEFGDEEFEITQFFLVPFFGACVHLPPPPPNQIVFVDYPEGLTLKSLYDAFWLSGKMITTLTENETATSAYTMKLDKIEAYYN